MTMMSIFSSFDVFSAESFGQRVAFSLPPTTTTKKDSNTSTATTTQELKKNTEKGRTAPPPQQQQGRKSRPRFAPELDGLNCFETIIPY